MIRPFSQLEHALADHGYQVRAPSVHAHDIDHDVATSGTCPECGGHMQFAPYHRGRPRSYRAFSCCRECDIGFEF